MLYRVVKDGRLWKVQYRTSRILPIWHDAKGGRLYDTAAEAGRWAGRFRDHCDDPADWARPIRYKGGE